MTTLRERWAEDGPTFGAWLVVPGLVGAEAVARLGFDFVCADLQHGAVGEEAVLPVIQAVALGGSRPIVRVRWNEPGAIGRALDAGAEGVVVPMVNSPAEAEAVVRAVRYPPLGVRSFGPFAASLRRERYAGTANDVLATIPMIETADALRRLDDILSVDGVDAVYVGPADLSLSLGLPPGNNDDRTEFSEALAAIAAACRRHGVVPGIHASGALAGRRVEQGFRMITVSSDLLALRTRMGEELDEARAGRSGAPAGDAIY
jgi:4-hydroxy-2-oxoheptanedioate aldolase